MTVAKSSWQVFLDNCRKAAARAWPWLAVAMILGPVVLACGCAAGPKPGEATITGGKAQASRHEDDGWEIVIEKAAPLKLQPVDVTLEIVEAPQ